MTNWCDPVVPLPLMTQLQKDNELERILEGFRITEEFDRVFELGEQEGYADGYSNGYSDGLTLIPDQETKG